MCQISFIFKLFNNNTHNLIIILVKFHWLDRIGNPHVQPLADWFETLVIPVTLVPKVVDVVDHVRCFDFDVFDALVFVAVEAHHVFLGLVLADFEFFDQGVLGQVDEGQLVFRLLGHGFHLIGIASVVVQL